MAIICGSHNSHQSNENHQVEIPLNQLNLPEIESPKSISVGKSPIGSNSTALAEVQQLKSPSRPEINKVSIQTLTKVYQSHVYAEKKRPLTCSSKITDL